MVAQQPGFNWAGNHRYLARALRRPTSVAQVCEIVSGSQRIHALGSRHSFNDVADSDGELITLDGLDPDFVLSDDRRSVTVSAGTRYAAVGEFLAQHGLTLRNFASLPHIGVAGAVATGTHGSGDANRCLAADVRAIEVVIADGELRRCERGSDDFAGLVVALGAIGIVVRVTLDVVPAFEVSQYVYEGLSWARFDEHVEEITALGYSVSLFTGYGPAGVTQIWVKARHGRPTPGELFGATPATVAVHPVPGMDAINTTEQLGAPGPAHKRLPHFRMGFVPSNGDELQSEYLIDRRDVVGAVDALRGLADRFGALLQVAEIRTVAADDLWLSPARGRDNVALHFTWFREPDAVATMLTEIEQALTPFDARPHWGKVFCYGRERLTELYPLLTAFGDLARRWDPTGKFRNPFLDRVLD
jgi:alditol oxidase